MLCPVKGPDFLPVKSRGLGSHIWCANSFNSRLLHALGLLLLGRPILSARVPEFRKHHDIAAAACSSAAIRPARSSAGFFP